MKKGEVTISLDEYMDLKQPRLLSFSNVKFKCPLCGHENKYSTHSTHRRGGKEIVYCDSDSGGCDKEIVLKSIVTCKVKVTAHKII